MQRLNYKHLHHFWVVARVGGIGRAAEALCLTPQTISTQVAALEAAIGATLFIRSRHSLKLTDRGRLVFDYADKIFALGTELVSLLSDNAPNGPTQLNVGIAEVVPKPIAYWMLEPVRRMGQHIMIVCYEGELNRLLADLENHKLDIVLADRAVDSNKLLNQRLIGESGISFYCGKAHAQSYRSGFPGSLHGAPLLLPTRHSALRQALERWFERYDIVPAISGEFEDTALMEVFGQAGAGIFVAPTLIDAEVQRRYRVGIIGHTLEVTQKFYSIAPLGEVTHPAVAAINEAASQTVWIASGPRG